MNYNVGMVRSRKSIPPFDLSGEETVALFNEAAEKLKRKPSDLARLAIEEWLGEWARKGKHGWESPLLREEASPPDRPKSGERAALRRPGAR